MRQAGAIQRGGISTSSTPPRKSGGRFSYSNDGAKRMIKIGDKIPTVTLKRFGVNGMEEVSTDTLFRGKVVLFSVPGAFTPTCSMKHLPGFIEQADAFKAKGIDRVLCL